VVVAMGLTYTPASERDRLHTRRASFSTGELLLALTSVVTMLAIGLAYAGTVRRPVRSLDRQINLNSDRAHRPATLEPVLASVFESPAERRAAAGALASYLSEHDLPNVGALARVRVKDQPLLTPAQLATLKPLVTVRTIDDLRSAVMWCALAMIASFHVVSLVWRLKGVSGDRRLLALAHLLVGIGFVVMLARPDPLRDLLLLTRYTQGIVIGVALFGALSLVNLDRPAIRELTYLPLAGAFALSVLLIFFGGGPGSSGARVNLGPIQPIEAIRLLLALFLAGYFARRWEVLRQVRAETIRDRRLPDWVNLPRATHALPVVVGVAIALIFFFLQKDLGPALLLCLMFLAMFAVARGGGWLAGAGVVGLVAGFAIGAAINLSSTLAVRLAMWQSPWDNAARGGDQVAHALWGLAAGATTGTGLGLGSTRFVPEGHTDLVLAGIGEELGFIGLLVAGAAFVLIAWRGLAIAKRASSDYRFFLAIALTLSLALPVLVMAAGILGLLPLTGVVTPFLSYGGSAMVANFAALGLLVAIKNDLGSRFDEKRQPRLSDLAPFRVPVRWLAGAMAACAVVIIATVAKVQAFRPDDHLVRPHMGVQADGGRRNTYNPRVAEAMRALPRGTIFDRTGQPLATNCETTAGQRCYPAGPALFHVLGDLNTRANWGASNSSYVERDADKVLRGFDDHRSLIPLVRHRWEPDHPEVKTLLARSRDVRLTIDARLQKAVAEILEAEVRRPLGAFERQNHTGKGAVIVLDAETGAILASVSYPFTEDPELWDPTLDRARYALYPPGSTFKLLTAAAALRESPAAHDREFTCTRLSNNRIGARLPGFGPPAYDDVKDHSAHGRIGMHDAIVKSCNAYFAQLAVALGSEPLARTAAAAGIQLNTSASPDRVRANLPHAGYGQGEVVATPLRMARVAAAIATDGTIREAPIVSGPTPTISTLFISPAAARTLAADLRQAVVSGTGRQLRDHPARIGGKTGTAEVDEAASHAWFVGFAPHDQAARSIARWGGTRRIAFAVVLEHAGYGGLAAAKVAGEVATAAASMGVIK